MKIRGLATSVVLLVLSVPAQSFIVCYLPTGLYTLWVSPECPAAGDSLTIQVYGSMHTCWSPPSLDSCVVHDKQINLYYSVEQIGPDNCLGWSESYFFDVPLGRIPPDTYQVVSTVSYTNGMFAGTHVCDSSFAFIYNGDANGDGVITSPDIILLVNYVFKSGDPPCGKTGDANCDGVMTAADLIFLVGYVFKSGPAPAAFCGP